MNFRPIFSASALALALTLAGCATRTAAPLELNLVGINDFHGHLEASKFTYTDARTKKEVSLQAGGIDNLGAALQAFRREDSELLLVGAGDLVGGSPAMSSMWADEPSIVALGMLGLRYSSVGNHEFDQGRLELLRQQNGGCVSRRPDKACKLAPDFGGAKFTYLAANVVDSVTGAPLLPAFRIEQTKGVKVAFIGAVVQNARALVLASGIVGLSFTDEAEAVNRAVHAARAQGATVFVLLIHEGGETSEQFDHPDCSKLKGAIVDIARKLDPALRLIISGHTHKGYQCKVDGRVITQGEVGGHVLSRIKLSVDPVSHSVLDIAVRNVAVKPGEYPADPKLADYLASVRARSQAALERTIAPVGARAIVRKRNVAGESALGSLIADAFVAATRDQGVQFGIMNGSGMRRDLDVGPDLVATFGQAQAVLPFGNTLVTMELTGAQIRGLLEQQWLRADPESAHDILQLSAGLKYRWDGARPAGQRVVAGSIALDGVALDETRSYRLVTNNFLAEGGDGFPMFRLGAKTQDTQIRDLDAFTDYLVNAARGGAPAGSVALGARIEKLK
jgi:5'-nucleotidase